MRKIKRYFLRILGFDEELYSGVTQEGPSRRDAPSALRLLADLNPQHDPDPVRHLSSLPVS